MTRAQRISARVRAVGASTHGNGGLAWRVALGITSTAATVILGLGLWMFDSIREGLTDNRTAVRELVRDMGQTYMTRAEVQSRLEGMQSQLQRLGQDVQSIDRKLDAMLAAGKETARK